MPTHQLDLPVIPHVMDGNLIQQRALDGYINATAMCKAAKKMFGHYMELKSTQDFLTELASETKMPPKLLVQTLKGGNLESQGSWVHPQVAIHLAQWLSAKFAVQVTRWVYEWLSGGNSSGTNVMPVHLQRYMVNRGSIPTTHFSMLNELTFGLIAPLEAEGYTLPDKLVPDISQGKMFCKWMREEKNVDPSTFPTYSHKYIDGRVVQARLYPNEYLADFRAHFNDVWLPNSHKYFGDRDPKALAFLPKLLAGPSK